VDQAQEFARSEKALKSDWEQKIRVLSGKERVALWGAGAKGATFANLIDEQRELIDCVVDLNPGKQGNFIPGTGHPIVSYRDLAERGVTSAILMNPNYREENLALLESINADIHLIERL
jgi:hypothetical protein